MGVFNRQLRRALITSYIIVTALNVQALAGDCVRPIKVAVDIGHTPKAAGTPSATGKTEYSFNKRFAEELVRLGQAQPKI